jgi:hypothetical protein
VRRFGERESSLGWPVVATEPDSRRVDDGEEVVDARVAAAVMSAAGVAVPARIADPLVAQGAQRGRALPALGAGMDGRLVAGEHFDHGTTLRARYDIEYPTHELGGGAEVVLVAEGCPR